MQPVWPSLVFVSCFELQSETPQQKHPPVKGISFLSLGTCTVTNGGPLECLLGHVIMGIERSFSAFHLPFSLWPGPILHRRCGRCYTFAVMPHPRVVSGIPKRGNREPVTRDMVFSHRMQQLFLGTSQMQQQLSSSSRNVAWCHL